MKAFFKRPVILLTALIGAAVFFEACTNKGCTDEDAINYNVVADKDDGTCEYCDSTHIDTWEDSVFLTDFNSSGGHYMETVAKITVVQKTVKYNYSSCGLNKCHITYTIENLTNQDFDLDYSLQFSGSGVSFSANNFIYVPANSVSSVIEIPETTISGNPCANMIFGSLGATSTSTIVYH